VPIGKALHLRKGQGWSFDPWAACCVRRLDGLVQEQRFPNVFYLWYRTLQVKGFGQDDLEDLVKSVYVLASEVSACLLHVDAVARAAEDKACFHGSCKSLGLYTVSRRRND
jgi:hypothetical protein